MQCVYKKHGAHISITREQKVMIKASWNNTPKENSLIIKYTKEENHGKECTYKKIEERRGDMFKNTRLIHGDC